MRIAEGLVELVTHSRWLASHALSFIDPAVQMKYRVDFDIAQEALAALSKPMAHIERLSEVPPAAFRMLCDGVMVLLVTESVLGQSPPTMHHFLTQGALAGEHDPCQVQLLVVRWLCAAGVVSLDELTAVVFGTTSPSNSCDMSSSSNGGGGFDTPTASNSPSGQRPAASPPRFSSTVELQTALARHLADAEPFYLGAHITILRGLLIRYCSSLVMIEDVVTHTDCLAPLGGGDDRAEQPTDDSVDPKSIDDALLLWMRRVVGLDAANAGQSPSRRRYGCLDPSQIEDLYLHTNDGRALATLVHHYRPDLVQPSMVHMLHPLTVWQRQDNWTAIIRAAESLDMWVGVFPEEIVTHGFSTLQLHVLRLVEELFVVLAGEAEAEFQLMAADVELDTSTQFVDVTRSNIALSLQLRRSKAAHVTAMSTNLVQLPAFDPHGIHPAAKFVPLPTTADHNAASDSAVHRDFPPRSQSKADLVSPDADTATTGPSPTQDYSTAVAAALRRSFANSGTARSVDAAKYQVEADDHRDDHGDDDGYSLVLTSMVLQGVAMPIRRPTESAARELSPAPAPLPALEGSVSIGSVAPPATAEEPPRSTSPTISTNAGQKRRTSVADKPAPGRAGLLHQAPNAPNPLARSVAYFARERKQLSNSLRLSTAKLSQKLASASLAIVQGSRDAEGVEELLQELSNLSAPATEAPAFSTADGLSAQNQRLRWALEHQQRVVREAVEKIKTELKRRDFDVVIQHLKQHGRPTDASPAQTITSAPPQPAVYHGLASYTPTLNALAMLGAAEVRHTSITEALAHAAAVEFPPPMPEDARAVPEFNEPPSQPPVPPTRSPPPSTAPEAPSGRAQPVTGLPETGARSTTAPAASGPTVKATATAFDISVGSSLGVKATQGVIPQLQRLKQRHAERREHNRTAAVTAPQRALDDEARTPLQPAAQTPHVPTGTVLPPIRAAKVPAPAAAPALPAGRSRNNKQLITNALRHICLTGAVNKPQLDAAVSIVDADDSVTHFVVLLKDEYNKQFRGLYQYRGDDHLNRVFGAGPLQVRLTPSSTGTASNDEATQMPSKLFKFDTGGKKFAELPAVTFNQMTDAITMPPRTRNGRPPL